MQLTNVYHAQLKNYDVTFLALTDANSSITPLKSMVLQIVLTARVQENDLAVSFTPVA
jgi:hypothetical protein